MLIFTIFSYFSQYNRIAIPALCTPLPRTSACLFRLFSTAGLWMGGELVSEYGFL
jgi:hypothetical protein